MKRKGFTLVELLLSISILGLLLALTGLSINNLLRRQDLQASANEIKESLYLAQSQTTNHVPTGIYFDADRFVVFFGDHFIPDHSQNQEHLLAAQITLSAINLVDQSVTFEPMTGYIQPFVSPANLTLADQQTGQSYLISLNRLGRVKIE
ncbi:MAG: prepilin-type N-terminal cleavage/methylation domain-containing protein [Candidatus Shapirobacteria bacterium]